MALYYVYEKATSKIVGKDLRPDATKVYRTHAAAQAAITRYANSRGYLQTDSRHPIYLYGIAETEYYHQNIERTVERTNAMTGDTFRESVNTPYAVSPASENYWCS
jgi:hypothetical protein